MRSKTEKLLVKHVITAWTAWALGERDNYEYAMQRIREASEAYVDRVATEFRQQFRAVPFDFNKAYQQFVDAPDAGARKRTAERVVGQLMDAWDSEAQRLRALPRKQRW